MPNLLVFVALPLDLGKINAKERGTVMKKITIVLNIILLGIFISNYADALCVNVPNANLRSGPAQITA